MRRLLALTFVFFILIPVATYAQTPAPVDVFKKVCDKNNASSATVCEENNNQKQTNSNPLFGKDGVITSVANLLSVISGIVAVIIILISGLRFIAGGNNPQDISTARNMIIYAAVGLVIVVAAQVIVRVFLYKI